MNNNIITENPQTKKIYSIPPHLENIYSTEKIWKIVQYPPEYKLFWLCGLPRSGKTTYAKQWVKEKGNRIIISGDSIRKAIHNKDFVFESEGLVFSIIDIIARAYLNDGYEVLIDETATSEETVKRYLKIDIKAQPIFINCDLATCILRAKESNKEYLIPTINRLDKQLKKLLKNFETKLNLWKKEILDRRMCDIN